MNTLARTYPHELPVNGFWSTATCAFPLHDHLTSVYYHQGNFLTRELKTPPVLSQLPGYIRSRLGVCKLILVIVKVSTNTVNTQEHSYFRRAVSVDVGTQQTCYYNFDIIRYSHVGIYKGHAEQVTALTSWHLNQNHTINLPSNASNTGLTEHGLQSQEWD